VVAPGSLARFRDRARLVGAVVLISSLNNSLEFHDESQGPPFYLLDGLAIELLNFFIHSKLRVQVIMANPEARAEGTYAVLHG